MPHPTRLCPPGRNPPKESLWTRFHHTTALDLMQSQVFRRRITVRPSSLFTVGSGYGLKGYADDHLIQKAENKPQWLYKNCRILLDKKMSREKGEKILQEISKRLRRNSYTGLFLQLCFPVLNPLKAAA